jgi:hypothetical protein
VKTPTPNLSLDFPSAVNVDGASPSRQFAMHSDLIVRVKSQLCAAWKWFRSLLKQDWELSDYPLAMREHEIDPSYASTRVKQHQYAVSIVNWWVMSGGGETEQEALQKLEKHFATTKIEKAKAKKSLPRPGTHVPLEFASRQRVGAHPELEQDFIHRVLNLEWAWLSDQSSLWDFHHAETNETLIAKIKDVYGVDVSDIESAKIPEILERIAARRLSGSLS